MNKTLLGIGLTFGSIAALSTRIDIVIAALFAILALGIGLILTTKE